MRRGIKALAAVVLAALLVPSSGSAASQIIECDGTADGTGTGSCSETFDLTLDDGTLFVSTLESWGDHDALGELGSVQLVWKDPTDTTIASYTCVALGLPAHLLRVPCTEDDPTATTYQVGEQTLEVKATGPGGAAFHGQIRLATEDELI